MAIEYVEGKMEEIWEGKTKTNKDMFTLTVKGNKISGFGTLLAKMKEAAQDGLRVRVGFTVSKDGKYMNYEPGEFLVVEDKGKQETLPQQPETPAEPKEEVFRSADTLEGMDHLSGEAARLMGASVQAFRNVYGKDPETEAEMASVNTVFIFLSKHFSVERWLRSYKKMTIEEHLRAAQEKAEAAGV